MYVLYIIISERILFFKKKIHFGSVKAFFHFSPHIHENNHLFMETFMEQVLLWVQTYGTPAIIVLIALEYACFPVSSELVLPFAGAFGAGMGISLPLLILYSSAAGLVGTSLTYAIGRYGGSPMMEKIMSRFPSTKKPILASTNLSDLYRLCRRRMRSAIPGIRLLFHDRHDGLEHAPSYTRLLFLSVPRCIFRLF